MSYVLHTPCPEIYCLRLIDEYCENYAEILCVLVYCIGMCPRQNSGQGVTFDLLILEFFFSYFSRTQQKTKIPVYILPISSILTNYQYQNNSIYVKN